MQDEEDGNDHSLESPDEITLHRSGSTMDFRYQRFPFCIVWTPIPLLTWLLPMIGHVGICTSEGVVHDYAGSNFVGVDDFAFGDPHKYVELEPNLNGDSWNECIRKADDKYSEESYNIIKNNDHSYVAEVLNAAKYKGRTNWGIFDVWKLTVIKSKYINLRYIIRAYSGFIVFIVLYFIFSRRAPPSP